MELLNVTDSCAVELDYYINILSRADFACENWRGTACSEKLEARVLNLATDMLDWWFF